MVTYANETAGPQALRYWSKQEVQRIAAILIDACSAWASRWLGPRDSARCEAAVAAARAYGAEGPTVPVFAWTLHSSDPAAEFQASSAWIGCDANASRNVSVPLYQLMTSILFDERADASSIAAEICNTACIDLLSTLRATLKLEGGDEFVLAAKQDEPLPAHVFGAWSGGVAIPLPVTKAGLIVYLNGACAEKILGRSSEISSQMRRPPQVPLLEALRAQPIHLHVGLRSVALSLGQLESLALGDVVVLPHALEEPVRVTGPSGEDLCVAYLVRKDERRAVELLREPSSVAQSG
jgi:hypothetical protein